MPSQSSITLSVNIPPINCVFTILPGTNETDISKIYGLKTIVRLSVQGC